ncbi:MAG: biopolymer transporter ExbD [Burkholderiaceae bacterium]|nr:biopolymer transporter ExbD [Burkholderiaceae bacterium]
MALLSSRQEGQTTGTPVVIEADKDVKYDRVMQVMSELQLRGVQKVGLLVKPAASVTK